MNLRVAAELANAFSHRDRSNSQVSAVGFKSFQDFSRHAVAVILDSQFDFSVGERQCDLGAGACLMAMDVRQAPLCAKRLWHSSYLPV
jgi:hypothetical protein